MFHLLFQAEFNGCLWNLIQVILGLVAYFKTSTEKHCRFFAMVEYSKVLLKLVLHHISGIMINNRDNSFHFYQIDLRQLGSVINVEISFY